MQQKSYHTRQRERILSYLKEQRDRHLSAEEILEHCGIGKSTVYRCLEKLAAEGMVRKYHLAGGSGACWQYAVSEGCAEHFHLKCVGCGGLVHLQCGTMDGVSAHIEREHGFLVDHTKTVLYGLCPACRKKEAAE